MKTKYFDFGKGHFYSFWGILEQAEEVLEEHPELPLDQPTFIIEDEFGGVAEEYKDKFAEIPLEEITFGFSMIYIWFNNADSRVAFSFLATYYDEDRQDIIWECVYVDPEFIEEG